MPVEHPNRPDAYGRERAARAGDDYAARRHVVMQRASELKRALMQSTMRLAPGAAAAYNGTARKAHAAAAQHSGSGFLRVCVALLSGALSMLIPFPSTVSLQGQLTAAAPAQLRGALVYAHPSQCVQLSLDTSASVIVAAPGLDAARFEGQITRLAPQVGSAEAPVCQVELQLLPNVNAAALPAEAELTVRFPGKSRDWLAVVMDKAQSDSRLRVASSALRSYTQFAWHHGVALIAYVTQHPDPQHYWGMLQQIVAQDEADGVAAD